MHRWLVAVLAAGCGSSAAVHDAAPGTQLTVVVHAMVGMVVSEPPGIRCGVCQMPQTSGVPCPEGPPTDRTCSAEFPPGTTVSLSLVGEDTYTGFVCASQPEGTVKSCSFVFDGPVTVGVWGEVPAR